MVIFYGYVFHNPVTSNSLILKSLPIFSGNESSNLRLMAGSILIYMQRVSYVYRYMCVSPTELMLLLFRFYTDFSTRIARNDHQQ